MIRTGIEDGMAGTVVSMNGPLTKHRLCRQNDEFRGTGGVSSGNCSLGFTPAFLDSETGRIYRSCYGDGRPAPIHLLDGLPNVLRVRPDGRRPATAVKGSVIPGFACNGRFYTRAEAARVVAREMPQETLHNELR
jgi:hypothetical protein